MTTARTGTHPDGLLNQSIIELLTKMTGHEIYYLLSDPQSWEKVMEEIGLNRDEADVLCYILHEELMRREAGSPPDGNPSEEERMFLIWYPLQRYKLEKAIQELNTIADQVDTTHRLLAQTSLAASSSGAVSAVVTILGLALAPVTGGGSLMLSAVGQGLGAAAAVTNILTSVMENRSNSAARDRASRLVDIPTTPGRKAAGGIDVFEVGTARLCIQRCVGNIRQLRAYQMAQANSGFMARVRNFVATGRVPFWRARGVPTAVGGPALAMTNGARMLGAAGASFLLMKDVSSFLQNWRHLEEGARAETAEELRTLAKELEQELSQLSQRYELITLRQAYGRGRRPLLPRRQEGRQGRCGRGLHKALLGTKGDAN